MSDRLIIFGAGGHGRVVADCARLMERWADIFVFDDGLGAGYSFDDLLSADAGTCSAFVAIGRNAVREGLQTRLQDRGFTLPIIRHPSAIVAGDAAIGAGTLLAAGSIVNPGAVVGQGCIINTAASIDHDCRLADFVHVAPGARLAGTVVVGARSWIGLAAAVIENLSLGADVTVAAGAVVIDNVEDRRTMMGVPAK